MKENIYFDETIKVDESKLPKLVLSILNDLRDLYEKGDENGFDLLRDGFDIHVRNAYSEGAIDAATFRKLNRMVGFGD